MVGIEQVANKIAIFLAENMNDYTNISQIVATRRHKEYKLFDKDEVIDIFQYGLEGVIGEVIKTLIILFISSICHILIPSLCIMLTFCTLRMLAGGSHMDTYAKCLTMGSILFLVPAWFIQHYNSYLNNIDIRIYYWIFISLIGIISIYAPVDCPEKLILELDKTKYKVLSIIHVLIVGIICVFINSNIIKISLLVGLILEVFSIIPIGIKTFNLIQDSINKIVSLFKGKANDKGCE